MDADDGFDRRIPPPADAGEEMKCLECLRAIDSCLEAVNSGSDTYPGSGVLAGAWSVVMPAPIPVPITGNIRSRSRRRLPIKVDASQVLTLALSGSSMAPPWLLTG